MNFVAILGFLLCLGILFLGLVVLIGACVKRKWKFAVRFAIGTLAAIVSVAGLTLLLIYLSGRPYDPASEADLKNAYRADFNVLPPLGITVLKARQIVVGDSACQWLLLKATPEEIQNHIAQGFTAIVGIPPGFKGDAGPNAPAWWVPPSFRLEFYENKNWSKAGGWWHSEAAIGIERSSGLIWFVASKMD